MSEEIRRANTYLNIYEMFPEAAKRVRILEELKNNWAVFVGRDVARFSQPYKLGVSELCVCVTKPSARIKLMNSKGTIARMMAKKFGYDAGEKFVLTLTDRIPAPKKAAEPQKRKLPAKIEVSEEKVSQYMQGAPETLPEDTNYAISHWWAFLQELRRKV